VHPEYVLVEICLVNFEQTLLQVLEKLLAGVVGAPESILGVMLRLAVPVMLFSSVCANGPVFAMALPLIQLASDLSGMDPRITILPIAFATSVGGGLSLIGEEIVSIIISEVI
jgi:Na+/H+ antiporter NhaD/arsenite permease-like protein